MMGGVVPTRSRGYRAAMICPVNFYLATTIYPGIYYTQNSYLSVVFIMDPSMPIPACSHQNMGDDDICLILVYTHILHIDLVAMYWYIMFCCWMIYPLTGHIPASSRSYPIGGYIQIPYGWLWWCIPISFRDSWLRKLSSACRRCGVMTHVSDPNSRTNFTTDL